MEPDKYCLDTHERKDMVVVKVYPPGLLNAIHISFLYWIFAPQERGKNVGWRPYFGFSYMVCILPLYTLNTAIFWRRRNQLGWCLFPLPIFASHISNFIC
jgi:hypothetical protein